MQRDYRKYYSSIVDNKKIKWRFNAVYRLLTSVLNARINYLKTGIKWKYQYVKYGGRFIYCHLLK